jgi:hypothetical protein
MSKPNRLSLVLVLAALVGCADASSGQAIPKSQLASVGQNVGTTRIDILYRRPVARGRVLFGQLVPYGRIWSPSADSAARITVSTPVEIDGHPLAAGTYGIWAIPDSTVWTLIFSGSPVAFHLRYPQGRDVLRVQARPAQGEHVETLEFDFPMVDADSAVLRLRWGSTVVPLKIRSRPGGG